MADPRLASIRAANRTTRELHRLFGKMGTSEHPRGHILAAYRSAHKSLRSIFARTSGSLAMMEMRNDVFPSLRRDVEGTANMLLADAGNLGRDQARAEVTAWGLDFISIDLTDNSVALDAWMSTVDDQTQKAMAAYFLTNDPVMVIGDQTRQGLVRADRVIASGANWLASTAGSSYSRVMDRSVDVEWGKQAIPVIDERTTDCCLRVAGQTVPFKGEFTLTGEPRFADKQKWSPFHWYCRTSVASVPLDMADDDVTRKLTRQSAQEREIRDRSRQIILEIQQELASLGTQPDGRRRTDDTAEITKMRRRLVTLRQRAGTVGGS